MRKLRYLPILLINTACFAESNSTGYNYQFDNASFVNHQVVNKLGNSEYNLEYTHNDTTSNTLSVIYDKVLAYKTGKIAEVTYTAGGGVLYGSGWSPIPMYDVDVNYRGINLNVIRTTKASPGLTPNSYSKAYSDNLTLTYEFSPFKDLSIIAGGKESIYQTGATSVALIGKVVYNVTDTVAFMYQGYYSYSGTNSIEFFNRKQFSYNRIMARYIQPIMDNNLVINIIAGPSLVEINNKSQIVPYHEEKITYVVNDDVKLEANNLCTYSIDNYHYCQIGGNINITF